MPLVLIHGAGGTHRHWPAELRRLPDRTVYALDLPGHGRSDGAGFSTVSAYREALFEFLEAEGLEKVVLAGHSMGGAVVQDFALHYGSRLAGMGLGARLFVRLLMLFGPAFRRFGLIRDQIHFLGNYSLAIIAVSGLFVGFVFGLQGYYTLQRYGSSEALGLLVTLTLVREGDHRPYYR